MEISKKIILEGNKNMAVFLGYCYYTWNQSEKFGNGFKIKKGNVGWWKDAKSINDLHNNNYLCRNHTELPFYRDWNHLMKVVEKIESIHDKHHGYFGVFISSNSCTIQGTKLHLAIEDTNYGHVYYNSEYSETKLKSVWFTCHNFLIWYNEKFI